MIKLAFYHCATPVGQSLSNAWYFTKFLKLFSRYFLTGSASRSVNGWTWTPDLGMIKLPFYHCATPVGQSFSKAWDIQQCYFSLVALPALAAVGLDPWIWMIKFVFYPYVIITGQCFKKIDISQCYKRFLFSTFYLLVLPSAVVELKPWMGMINLVFCVIISGQCFQNLGIS